MGLGRVLSDWKIRNPGLIPGWSKKIGFAYLRATQHWRALPDYCIIGAQKSGTTSLYSYLALHPEVKPSYVKEIHYYNQHFNNGLKWYRSHFPIGSHDPLKRSFITGEASTMYLHHEEAPLRMINDCPDIRLLLVLRNPVGRAVSHYHHRVRTGREKRQMSDALRLALKRAEQGDFTPGTETDYLAYGRYVNYLSHWTSMFTEEQFLVLQAEALFVDPRCAFERVSSFLGISFISPESDRKFNKGSYENERDVELSNCLRDYFEPYNQKLYDSNLVDFKWTRSLSESE